MLFIFTAICNLFIIEFLGKRMSGLPEGYLPQSSVMIPSPLRFSHIDFYL